ncbi:MAG: caspase family protein [Elusimicrobiota bacterium]|nr:caspase family protein [Elusimicrobiota bacterium]
MVLYGLTGGKTAAPKPVAPAKLTASVALVEPSGDRRLAAGEKAELVVKVTNAGPGKAHGLRVSAGLVEPVAGLKLPETVLAGDLSPGGSLERRLPLTGLVSLAGGKARVRLSAREANGFDAPDALIEFETVALKAPRLEVAALSVGGAGVVKPAEVNKLSITLRNAGEGPAQAVVAELVPGDADVFPAGETRRELGVIAAGESRRFDFEFFVNARFKGKALPVALTVSESLGRFGFSRRGLGLVLGQAPDAQVVTVQGRDQAAAATASDDVDEPPLTKAKADPDALAVVIGIERYRQAGLPGVDHAGRDARAVHAYLTKSMGVDPRNAVLLLDEGAAKGDLDKYLGPWLKNRANSRSRVFVFFAGHGAPDAATGEAYLVPFDGDPAYTKDTAFPLRRLYDSLKELPAKDATVLLDSCFSGQGGRSLIAKGTRPLVTVRTDLAVGGNTAALAASGPGQISSSYDAAGHGLMTYHLLRGLRGGADADRDGRVTFGELADFVGPEVEREARLSNVEQTPQTLPAREELGARAKRVLIELR